MSCCDDAAARIEAFVRRQFGVSPADPHFGRSTHLFDGGYIDSMGVIELLEFLEEEFDASIPEEDLVSDAFTTICGIAAIVSRLSAPSAG